MLNGYVTKSALMKPIAPKSGRRAFTALELAVVISMIALTVLLLFPTMRRPRDTNYARLSCVNNLKQVGLAFRMWKDDNGVYPMQFQTNNFDGPSFALRQKMYVYYQVMSNELNNPKIVVCFSDTNRISATNFSSDFGNSRVSYFVGLDASETNAQMFLAGDRHIDNGKRPKNGLLDLKTKEPVHWTKAITTAKATSYWLMAAYKNMIHMACKRH